MTDRPTSTKPRAPGAEQVDASSTYPSTFARSTPHEVARAVVDANTSGHVLTAFSWAKFDRVAKYKALFSKLRVAPVSDAEAEAVADAACGAPVDSAVSRAYVGPGPERLKARFRW